MPFSPEKLTASVKGNLDSAYALTHTALASAERLAALNMNTARALFDDAVATVKATLELKDPKELIAYQASLAQPAVEKAVAYSKSVYEIATQSKEAMSGLVEAKFAGATQAVHDVIDGVAKKAPAGTEAVFSTLKSAINSAGAAYDQMVKVTKQATDTAEANVTAATSATVKAISTATKSKKAA